MGCHYYVMHPGLWKVLAPGPTWKKASWFPGTQSQYVVYCRRVAGTIQYTRNPLIESLYRYREGEPQELAAIIDAGTERTIEEVNAHTTAELDARLGPAPSAGESAAQAIARLKMQMEAVRNLATQDREQKKAAEAAKKAAAAAKKKEAAAKKKEAAAKAPKRRRTD